MATVRDVKVGFEAKGLHISFPYPEYWQVKRIDLLEKIREASKVRVLLAVTVITDKNREISDFLYAESAIEKEIKPETIKAEKDYKTQLLPLRGRMDFSDEVEARAYPSEAFGHLLIDKGYEISSDSTVDLLGTNKNRLFFIMVGLRCDDEALGKAKGLIQIRKEKGGDHDYGLVI